MNDVSEGSLKDGWVRNTGEMPVKGSVRIDTMWDDGNDSYRDKASEFVWDIAEGITHWRLHNAACGSPPKSLDEAYNHLNTGNWQESTPVRMSAAEYIKSLEPLIEEQPIGLPLSRVCKAFEAITGKPMSEEHAETFLSVVEMCKLYATEDDLL